MLVMDRHIENVPNDRTQLAVHVSARPDRPPDEPRDHDPPVAQVVDMRSTYLQEASH